MTGSRDRTISSRLRSDRIKSTILTMLPEGSHVREVYLSKENGILMTLPADKNSLLIDMSTIDTATSSAVASALSSSRPYAKFHDAPVSGGVLGAQKGTLTFMLGIAASASHFSRVETLLRTMGLNIFPCGGPTLGLVAKLCNNYCSGLIAIATSEAFSIAIAQGMDPRILKDVFRKSLAQSTINDAWNPVPGLCPDAPASRGYEGGFRVGLMRKDFNLAVKMGEERGVGLRLALEGKKVYEEAEVDERCMGRDSRVVFRYLGGDEGWKERFPDGEAGE